MKPTEIRIRFQEPSATLLEVVTGAHEASPARIFEAVEGLALRPHHPYLVQAGERLITRFKVTQRDGTPLSVLKAAELINRLRLEPVAENAETETPLGDRGLPTAA